jgi:hypothetical protein
MEAIVSGKIVIGIIFRQKLTGLQGARLYCTEEVDWKGNWWGLRSQHQF